MSIRISRSQLTPKQVFSDIGLPSPTMMTQTSMFHYHRLNHTLLANLSATLTNSDYSLDGWTQPGESILLNSLQLSLTTLYKTRLCHDLPCRSSFGVDNNRGSAADRVRGRRGAAGVLRVHGRGGGRRADRVRAWRPVRRCAPFTRSRTSKGRISAQFPRWRLGLGVESHGKRIRAILYR
jgi:hypothetical protein